MKLLTKVTHRVVDTVCLNVSSHTFAKYIILTNRVHFKSRMHDHKFCVCDSKLNDDAVSVTLVLRSVVSYKAGTSQLSSIDRRIKSCVDGAVIIVDHHRSEIIFSNGLVLAKGSLIY